MRAAKTTRVRAAGCALLISTGCSDGGDRFGPIVVDIAANCPAARAEVLAVDLQGGESRWKRPIAVAVDQPGADRYWMLAEVEPSEQPGTAQLALLHIEGASINAQVLLDAALVSPDASFELRSGPLTGTAWLLQRGRGVFRVWHVDAGHGAAGGLVGVSDELGGFPPADLCVDEFGARAPCDVADWPRELVFLTGLPFIVSVAPFSPDEDTYVYSARFEPDLALGPAVELGLDDACGDMGCPDRAGTTYPSLFVMGSQTPNGPRTHRFFLLRQRSIGAVPEPSLEHVLLDLRLEAGEMAGTVKSQLLDEVDPAVGPPSGLAIDDFATYMLHPDEFGQPVIIQVGDDQFDFEPLHGIDIASDASLLQLSSDIALGRIVDGAWEVTKLFPDEPSRSETMTYIGSADVETVVPAGHGAFLLFEKEGGPDLVQLVCDDDHS